MNKSISYRADIDGLRAVAVLAVIFYHAKFLFGKAIILPGGYLGVDIFFTISGFLITSLLIKNINLDFKSFLKSFYVRRIRRLFPALFFLLIVLVLFASFFFDGYILENFSKSIFSSLFFYSNYFFWSMGESYAALPSQFNPLLHTWSLSVEEQFYFLFPIFFFFSYKIFKKKIVFLLIASCLISLIGSEYYGKNYTSFNFYGLPSRYWEIAVGSICACLNFKKLKSKKFFTHYFADLGFVITACSFFLYNDDRIHPSITSSLPVIGTVLIIIFSNRLSVCYNFFTAKFMVFIGLISYSLYLWHFPIFSIAKIISPSEMTNMFKLFLITISFGISIFSYYFIEQPFRNQKIISAKIFYYIIFVTYIFLIFSTFVFTRYGSLKKEHIFLNIENNNEKLRLVWWEKIIENKSVNFTDSKNIKLLIIGNSHARDLLHAFVLNQELFPHYEFAIFDTQIDCFMENIKGKYDAKCKYLYEKIDNEKIVSDFHKNLIKSDYIILSTEWSLNDILKIEEAILPYFNSRGKKVVITSNTPKFFFNMKKTPFTFLDIMLRNIKNVNLDKKTINDIDGSHYKSRSRDIIKLNDWLEEIALRNDIGFLRKEDFMCDKILSTCYSITPDGYKVFWDNSHYTLEGARYLGRKIFEKKWLSLK